MTIKEMEAQSGLARANIRFYETHGLLAPVRQENGYRDYSQEDLHTLLKIRLLRTLGVSLDEIRAMQNGQKELYGVLAERIDDLQQKQLDAMRSQQLCRTMQAEGARYETLDAAYYLSSLEQPEHRSVPEEDRTPPVRAPIRRFLARWLDFLLYGMIWDVVLALCKINITARSGEMQLLDMAATVVLMLVLEPLFLSWFGTTPGKWALGLFLTDWDGEKLTRGVAWDRLKMLLWRGYGFFFPIYSLVRLWKSYHECEEGLLLDWESESVLTLRIKKPWMPAARAAGILVVTLALSVLSIGYSELPRHRGELTVAEFCENYNQLARYYGEYGGRLTPDGQWEEPQDRSVALLNHPMPEFVFSEADGHMTGMHFTVEQHGADSVEYGYRNQMLLAVLAFVRAQPGGGLFSKEAVSAAKQLRSSDLQDISLTACGVEIRYEIRYRGYMPVDSLDALWPEEGGQTYYAFSFSMEKR